MENIIKIQESFEELTKEVEKFRSMSELAQSHQLTISEMSKQFTKVIANFEKYRNLMDERIDRQSNLIESLLVELRNTQQGIDKNLDKFDDTLTRNLKSIIVTCEQQVTNSENNIIRTLTKGNDQIISEFGSIQSSVDEFRNHHIQFIDIQSKNHENIIKLFQIFNNRQKFVYHFLWSLLFVMTFSLGIIVYILHAK